MLHELLMLFGLERDDSTFLCNVKRKEMGRKRSWFN